MYCVTSITCVFPLGLAGAPFDPHLLSCLFVMSHLSYYIFTDIHAANGTSTKSGSPLKTFQVIEMIMNYKESEDQEQDYEKQMPGTVLFVAKINLSKFNVEDLLWMKTGNGILKYNGQDVLQKVYYQSRRQKSLHKHIYVPLNAQIQTSIVHFCNVLSDTKEKVKPITRKTDFCQVYIHVISHTFQRCINNLIFNKCEAKKKYVVFPVT